MLPLFWNYSDCRIFLLLLSILYSNMTSFFRFVNKWASYPFGIISLAHAPVNVTDFSIGSINCNPNNADRGRSIIRVTLIVCDIFRKRKYRLPSCNQSILPYLYSYTYQNRNKSWKPECVLSFNMDWRILVNFIPRFCLGIKY